jgi:hypothetical protein
VIALPPVGLQGRDDARVDPRPQIGLARRAYRIASFATTTVGFGWATCSILQALD